jgi:[ribosomal protein S5]-alanine N-acetyltransferase
MLPTIPTPRLRLRRLMPADVTALHAVFGDPEACRFLSRPPLRDLADAESLLAEIEAHAAAGTLFQWGIALRGTDEVIGTFTLANLTLEHRRAEVGYAIARAQWGRGFMGEVMPAMVRHAFVTLDLHRLEADVDPRNGASIHVLERAGFRREGHMRERYHVNGEVQDSFMYGLLRREWGAR